MPPSETATRVALDAESRRLLLRLPELVAGSPAWLVTVFAVHGSVPRGPGARLVCRGGRLVVGTIGGGRLEERALERAREAETRGSTGELVRFELGPELSQCCGGVVELLLAPVDASEAERLRGAVLGLAPGQPLRTCRGGRELIEEPGTAWTALICGAGHVGAALGRVLGVLPWRVVVLDERSQWADPERFGGSVEVCAAAPIEVLAGWGWLGGPAAEAVGPAPLPAPDPARTLAVVMTHDHGLDRDLARVLLGVGEHTGGARPAYVGVIGSRTKIALLKRRLRDLGLPPERLDALVAPIGARVGGRLLGGKLPGEIAVSVAAQLLAVASELGGELEREGLR